jgi:class I fructose-bisphosphate aldolase
MLKELIKLIGKDRFDYLTTYTPKVSSKDIILPKDFLNDRVLNSNLSINSIKNLSSLFNFGRLSNTGYLSILPVDHGIEHLLTAFNKNISYFNPENIVKLALDAGCNGVVSSLHSLRSISRKYAHKIPFIVKLNHNDRLSNKRDIQKNYGSVKEAYNLGAVGIAATLYIGHPDTNNYVEDIAKVFEEAHQRGMFTILWAYLRNPDFNSSKDYHYAADMLGQANYIASNIGADIVKQKMPKFTDGLRDIFDYKLGSQNLSDHPIDMTRYQVLSNFSGRVGLLNSGGPSTNKNSFETLVEDSIINKLSGGMGIMAGRKIIEQDREKAIEMLNFIQNIYLSKEIRVI